MRSNALKKEDLYLDEAPVATSPALAWEIVRRRIAVQAEEACHLPGNINGPDLGDFEEKYGAIGVSDFA